MADDVEPSAMKCLSVELPEVSRHRVPVGCRSDLPRIEKEVSSWAWTCLRGLPGVGDERVLRLIGQDFPRWLSMAYRSGPIETVVSIGKWMHFWFLLDDLCSEPASFGSDSARAGVLVGRLQGVMEPRREKSTDPFSVLLRELWADLRRLMSEAQRCRFSEYVVRMLDGFVDSVRIRESGKIVTLAEYREMRHYDSGMPWTYLLVELSGGLDLTETLDRRGDVRELLSASVWNAVLGNDVIAFGKEYFSDDNFNAVSLTSRNEFLSIQESLDRVAELAREAEDRVFALCDEIADGSGRYDADLDRYVALHKQMIAGTLEWQYRSPRYHGPGYAWVGSTSGPVTLTSHGTRHR